MTHKNRAFFLDRDGTINVDYDFVHKPEEWTWCENAIDALKRISDEGYRIIIITNQSGIIRKRYSMEDVEHLHRWVDEQLKPHGVIIDRWYIAPWHPDFHDGYDPALLKERKPGTALFEDAIRRFQIDPEKSFMAGDKISDLKPAIRLGIRPFLIKSVHTANQDISWLQENRIIPEDSLFEVVNNIFGNQDHYNQQRL